MLIALSTERTFTQLTDLTKNLFLLLILELICALFFSFFNSVGPSVHRRVRVAVDIVRKSRV